MTTWRPIPDPPPRANGGCAECGKPREGAGLAHGDPFCRTECAKAWHERAQAGRRAQEEAGRARRR